MHKKIRKRGGARAGSGSKPRMVAVGKSLVIQSPAGARVTIQVVSFDGKRAVGTDERGQEGWLLEALEK